MFKKLKQKIGEGAEKVAQQVNAASPPQTSASEGNLIDIDEQPANLSTPKNRPAVPTSVSRDSKASYPNYQ